MNKEERIRGKVRFFNHNKGYGFINVPDQEKGIFVHITDVLEGNEYLEEGEEVEFEMGEGPKGPKAINVKRVEEKKEIEEEEKISPPFGRVEGEGLDPDIIQRENKEK